MSEEYQMWAPTKPASQYEDDELKDTGPYKRLEPLLSSDPANLLKITRETIESMWEAVQTSRYTDTIAEVFRVLEDDDIDHGGKVLITQDEKGICKYELVNTKTRKRFSHSNYKYFIGRGTPKDSDLYREAVKLLREKCGLDESALHGGFLLVKDKMRSERKNGVFELVLEKGREGNGNTDKFVARLYQYPFQKQAVPTIVFPPVSGEKGPNATLRVTDTEQEVPSMSQMLKSAIIKGAMTPAVVFGLDDLLKKERAEGKTTNTNDGDDGDDDDDDDAPSNITASTGTVQAQPERPKSAAHALLDDDDDD